MGSNEENAMIKKLRESIDNFIGDTNAAIATFDNSQSYNIESKFPKPTPNERHSEGDICFERTKNLHTKQL